MPMLHGCAFFECETLTLSTYCFEHEQLTRSELEAERARLAGREEPATREPADAVQALA